MGNAPLSGKKKLTQYTEFPLPKNEKEGAFLGQIPNLFSFTAVGEVPYLCTMQPKQQQKNIKFAVTDAEHYYEKIISMEELREMKDALENNKAPVPWWEFFTAIRHVYLHKKVAISLEKIAPPENSTQHSKRSKKEKEKIQCKLHLDLNFEKLGRTVLTIKLYETPIKTTKAISQQFMAPLYQFYAEQIDTALATAIQKQQKLSKEEESEQHYRKAYNETKKELQRANGRIQQLESQLRSQGNNVEAFKVGDPKLLEEDEINFPAKKVRRYMTTYKKRILGADILTTPEYYAFDKMVSALTHYSNKTEKEQLEINNEVKMDDEVMDYLKTRFQTRKRRKKKKKSMALTFDEDEEEEEQEAKKTIQDVVKYDQQRISAMFDRIDEWNFDVFTLNELCHGHSLLVTGYTLFVKYDLLAKYNVPEKVMIEFLKEIEYGYHDNPYHNSLHACDVMQVLHVIINRGGLRGFIKSHSEVFGALVAAIIHDFDHPGLNNPFQINSSSYLALLYNDRSVLENHHVAHTFDLMRQKKYNILAGMDDDLRKSVRELIIGMVLATDMNNHAKYVAKFKMRLDNDADFSSDDDLRLALQIGIKMADVSNPTRPLFIYLRWTEKILEEFFAQGDMEKKMNIPVSPLMDRKHSKVKEGQMAFIKYVILPMFELWKQLCPRMGFSMEYIKLNQRYWETHEAIDPRDFKEQPIDVAMPTKEMA